MSASKAPTNHEPPKAPVIRSDSSGRNVRLLGSVPAEGEMTP